MIKGKLNKVVESFTGWVSLQDSPLNEAFASTKMKYFFDTVVELMMMSKYNEHYNGEYINGDDKKWKNRFVNYKNRYNQDDRIFWNYSSDSNVISNKNEIIQTIQRHTSSILKEKYDIEEPNVRLSEIPDDAIFIIKGRENVEYELLRGRFKSKEKDNYLIFLYTINAEPIESRRSNVVSLTSYKVPIEIRNKVEDLVTKFPIGEVAFRKMNKDGSSKLIIPVAKTEELRNRLSRYSVSSSGDLLSDNNYRRKEKEELEDIIDYYIDLNGNKIEGMTLEDAVKIEGDATFIGLYSSNVNTRSQYENEYKFLSNSYLTKGGLRASFHDTTSQNVELFAISLGALASHIEDGTNPKLNMSKDEIDQRQFNREHVRYNTIESGEVESPNTKNIRNENLERYKKILKDRALNLMPRDLHYKVLEKLFSELNTSFNMDTTEFIKMEKSNSGDIHTYIFKCNITDELIKSTSKEDAIYLFVDIISKIENNLVSIGVKSSNRNSSFYANPLVKYYYHIKTRELNKK